MKRNHRPSLASTGTRLKGAAARQRAPLAMVVAMAWVAFFVGYPRPALAKVSCGVPPQFSPVDVKAQVEADAKAKANQLLQAPPKTNVRKLAVLLRREMRRKFANVEKSVLDRYFLFATCRDISNDPALEESQVYDEYSDFYRVLSEPIDKADTAVE